jgi:hypothetical protein
MFWMTWTYCGLEKYKRTCTLASSQSNPSYHLLAYALSASAAIKPAYIQLRLERYNSAMFNSDLKATLDIHLRRELEL